MEKAEQQDSSSCGLGHGAHWLRGKLIGKGSYGSVFLATLKEPKSPNCNLPETFAVKSAHSSVSETLKMEKDVFYNIEKSPYVLGYYGEEETTAENGDKTYNLLLEYADGADLATVIKTKNSNGGCGLSELEVRCLTRSILGGLKQVHESGFVHRDLKPENILITSSNSSVVGSLTKLADFGLSKPAEDSPLMHTWPHTPAALVGTIQYWSPETVGDKVQEKPSDIWSFGCIVFEMLTGKPARVKGSDEVSTELMMRIGDSGALPEIPVQIQQDARDFLNKCFELEEFNRMSANDLMNHPFVQGV